jgi:hypothetical protein
MFITMTARGADDYVKERIKAGVSPAFKAFYGLVLVESKGGEIRLVIAASDKNQARHCDTDCTT